MAASVNSIAADRPTRFVYWQRNGNYRWYTSNDFEIDFKGLFKEPNGKRVATRKTAMMAQSTLARCTAIGSDLRGTRTYLEKKSSVCQRVVPAEYPRLQLHMKGRAPCRYRLRFLLDEVDPLELAAASLLVTRRPRNVDSLMTLDMTISDSKSPSKR